MVWYCSHPEYNTTTFMSKHHPPTTRDLDPFPNIFFQHQVCHSCQNKILHLLTGRPPDFSPLDWTPSLQLDSGSALPHAVDVSIFCKGRDGCSDRSSVPAKRVRCLEMGRVRQGKGGSHAGVVLTLASFLN